MLSKLFRNEKPGDAKGQGSERSSNLPLAIRTVEPVASIDALRAEAYLAVNPDVRAAQLDARYHFENYGHAEGRVQAVDPDVIRAMRIEKLAQVSLRASPSGPLREDAILDFLPSEIRDSFEIPDAPPVAENDYALDIIEKIKSSPEELFLDVGAGFRHTYYHNVVNAEIWPALSTDVLCVGEQLPFADCTFDHVLCLAVLEHTKRPWIAVQEILRVLKPGGTVRIDWPFLQPFHGYPHHFFNATSKGTISLFEEQCDILSADVRPWQHPIFALSWMLEEWSNGLPESTRQNFQRLTVGEILANPKEGLLGTNWCSELPAAVQDIISAGTTLIARKRHS